MNLLDEFNAQFEQKKEEPVNEERELFTHLEFIEAHRQYTNAYGYIIPKKYRDEIYDPAQLKNIASDMFSTGEGFSVHNENGVKHIPVEEIKNPTDVIGKRPPGMEEAMIRNGVIPDINVKSPADNKPEPIHIEVRLSEPQQLTIEPKTDDKGQANLFDSFNFVDTPIDEEKQPFLDKKIDFTEQKSYDGTLEKKFIIDEAPWPYEAPTGEIKIYRDGAPVKTIFENEEKGQVRKGDAYKITSDIPVVQIEGKDFIELIILGDPTAQKRHKHRHIPGTKFVQNYDPSAADKADFLAIVQSKAPEQPLVGPIRMDIYAFFARPKSHYRTGSKSHILKDDAPEWKISTPDRDNLDKFVMDALNSIFWKDDSQICAGEIEKKYDNITPRTIIRISRP